MTITGILMSPRGLLFDRYLVRYTGYSLLNWVFARQVAMEPRPALLLQTRGCKSGLWRRAVLPYFHHGHQFVIVGSRGGMPEDPAWVVNLRAHPWAEIIVGRRLHWMQARFAVGVEYQQLWDQITAAVPTYAQYQQRCEGVRQIPLVVLSQGRSSRDG